MFLYTKSYTLYITGFFMKFLKLSFIYTKSMTFCVTWRFYIQKARHFAKSKTICNTFLYTKIWHFAFRDLSLDFWNLQRGGRFIYWKTMHFAWYFYIKKTMHFALRFYIQRAWHYALHFNIQKTMYFLLRLYIYNLSCSPDT